MAERYKANRQHQVEDERAAIKPWPLYEREKARGTNSIEG
jgi:hypothetical protein